MCHKLIWYFLYYQAVAIASAYACGVSTGKTDITSALPRIPRRSYELHRHHQYRLLVWAHH
jgi:hypothetical protein